MARGAQSRVQDEVRPDVRRAAVAVRELRRSTSTPRFRDSIFGDLNVLDIAQHDALEVIVTLDGARMSEVAQALRVDPSTATRTWPTRSAVGLVERRPDPADGRSVMAVATPAGRRCSSASTSGPVTPSVSSTTGSTRTSCASSPSCIERLVAGVDELAEAPLRDRTPDRRDHSGRREYGRWRLG